MKGEDLSVEEAGSTVFAGSLRDLPLAPAGDHTGTEKRIVFGPGRFWEDYVARFFSVDPGISTPFHAHDWPHYVLITGGSAKGKIMGQEYELEAGSWAFVPENTEHCFDNVGRDKLTFLCIVPKKGDLYWQGEAGSC